MYNYLSVGVDALVALEFHRARQGAWWYLWPSRFLNKVGTLYIFVYLLIYPNLTNLKVFITYYNFSIL